MECFSCGLPDPYDGDGDGIGSCECPRCDECGAEPLGCRCAVDDDEVYLWHRPVVDVKPAGGVL